jgi:hypothetical protein
VVGVAVASLDKSLFQKYTGSTPENVNFGIKASVAQMFVESNGLNLKYEKNNNLKKTMDRHTFLVLCE